MTNPSEPQHPTTVLRSEHQTILRVIAVLARLVARSEQGDGFEHAALRRCVSVIFSTPAERNRFSLLLDPAGRVPAG